MTRDICLMGTGTKQEGDRLFSVVASDKTRGVGHKVKHWKFRLNISRNFFTLRVLKHLNKFPREEPFLDVYMSKGT